MASVRCALSLKDWVQSEVWVRDRDLLLQKLDNLGIYKVHHLIQFPLIYCQLQCLGLDSHEERALMPSIWELEKLSTCSGESSSNQQTIEEWVTSEVQVSNPDECVQRFHDLGIEQTAQLLGFPHIHDLVKSLESLKLFEKLRLTQAMQLLRKSGDLDPRHNTAREQGKMLSEQRNQQPEKRSVGDKDEPRNRGKYRKKSIQTNGNSIVVRADSSTPSGGACGPSDTGLVDRAKCQNSVDQGSQLEQHLMKSAPEESSVPGRQDIGQVPVANISSNPIASTSFSLGPGTSNIAPNSLNMFNRTGTLPKPIQEVSQNNYSIISPRVGLSDHYIQSGSYSTDTQTMRYDLVHASNSHNMPHTVANDACFQSFTMPFSPVQVDNVLAGVHDQGGTESRTVAELGAQSQHDQNDNSLIDVVSVQETRHKPPGTTDILVKTRWGVDLKSLVHKCGFHITQTREIICCTKRGIRILSADGKELNVPFKNDVYGVKRYDRVAVNQQTGDVIITQPYMRSWLVYIKDGFGWTQKFYRLGEEWQLCELPVSWTPTGQVVMALYRHGGPHIVKYNKEDGQQVWSCPTECDRIADIAVDSRGYIYCCDIDGECVRVYNTEGSLSHTVPRDPDTVHPFRRPQSICVDSSYRLLVLHHKENLEIGDWRAPRVVTLWSSVGDYMTTLMDNLDNVGLSGIRLLNDQTLVASSGRMIKSYNISLALKSI